jgi:hypothetical protein
MLCTLLGGSASKNLATEDKATAEIPIFKRIQLPGLRSQLTRPGSSRGIASTLGTSRVTIPPPREAEVKKKVVINLNWSKLRKWTDEVVY